MEETSPARNRRMEEDGWSLDDWSVDDYCNKSQLVVMMMVHAMQ
jgi:hypothetical protein